MWRPVDSESIRAEQPVQVFRLYSQHFFSFILISAFLASAEFAKPLSVLDMLRVLFEGKKIKMIYNKLFSWVG